MENWKLALLENVNILFLWLSLFCMLALIYSYDS